MEQVDFVVFSGDLAFSGKPDEYEAAKRHLLVPVLDATGLDEQRLVIVPGNKQGRYLPAQWRIQLTIPPWLPEEEVLRAFRLLRGERPKGRKLPKTAGPLEVARFVWEQERLVGYRKPSPWRAWFERWNELHPGYRFKSYRNFREYFFRGNAAVQELDYSWPEPQLSIPEDE